ncbi:MAG: amidohydrolase family protein, partial [Proteobacteria bacterium]|nr:amidohydrolase family protein [Pseudomonadota bacterium]
MNRLGGHILTPSGFIAGDIEFATDGPNNGRIADISGTPVSESIVRNSKLPLILPGFIDLHVHGGGGRDIMEGGDAASRVAEMHARHGTTALLATTMTAPAADLQMAFAAMAPLFAGAGALQQHTAGARILGVHLEGPYINAGKLGAQPDFARPIQLDELGQLNALAPIKLITLAPEIPANMAAIESLCAAGYRVQIGHTQGSYEEGVTALDRGA